MQYDPDDFTRLGQWKCPVLEECLWVQAGEGRFLQEIDVDVNEAHVYIDGHVFKSRASMRTWEDKIREKLDSEQYDFIHTILDIAEEETEKLLQVEETVQEVDAPYEAFTTFYNQYLEVTPAWNAAIIIGDIMSTYIEQHYSPELLKYCNPDKPTYRSRMRKEQVALRDALQDKGILHSFINNGLDTVEREDSELARRIKDHVERYAWMETQHFWGKGYDMERLQEDITDVSLPEQKTPPEHMSLLIQVARRTTWYRNYTGEVANKVSYAATELFETISDSIHSPYEDIIWMKGDEIRSALQSNSMIDQDKLEERRDGYAAYQDSNVVIQTGNELATLRDEWIPTSTKEQVQGNTGYEGRATGEVTIVLEPDDIKNMNEGDILVASETTPDFLPAMRKAAAIVTNRGGVTSHAAITAREMETPCVIGTGEATEVLEDGDTVHVNADEGVVRRD